MAEVSGLVARVSGLVASVSGLVAVLMIGTTCAICFTHK